MSFVTPEWGLPGQAIAAHEFIAGKGMLSPNERADMGIEGNVRIGNRFLFASAGNGLTITEATEYLYEEGYIQEEDEQAARNLIKRSLTNPQYTPEGVERMAELEAEQQRKNFDAEQEAIALAQEAEDNAYDATVAAVDAAVAQMEFASPYNDLEISEALLAVGYAEQEVTNERNETGEVQTPAGSPDAGAAGPVAGVDQSPAEVAAGPGAQSDSRREGAPGSDSRSGSEAGLVAPSRPRFRTASGFAIVTRTPKMHKLKKLQRTEPLVLSPADKSANCSTCTRPFWDC